VNDQRANLDGIDAVVLGDDDSIDVSALAMAKLHEAAARIHYQNAVARSNCELSGAHRNLQFFYDFRDENSVTYDVMRAHCVKCDLIIERPLTPEEQAKVDRLVEYSNKPKAF